MLGAMPDHRARPPNTDLIMEALLEQRAGSDSATAGPTATASLPPASTVESATNSTGTEPTTESSTISVQLPSSTIIALGLGFVAAACVAVLITILIRLWQVRQATSRARAEGETITYRQMWDRWGGWWGLVFAQDDSSLTPESIWAQRRRMLESVRHLEKPNMWEVPLNTVDCPEYEFDYETAQPLSASPYHVPKGDDEVAFSVLVRLPSPPEDNRAGGGGDMGGDVGTTSTHSQRIESKTKTKATNTDDDEEEYPVLPDIMLGTTHVTPSEPLGDAGIQLDRPEALEERVISYVPQPRAMVERHESSWAQLTSAMSDSRQGL